MATDMVLPRFLSKDQFVFRTRPNTCGPALRFKRSHCGADCADVGQVKKNVTFADDRGLCLTQVKVFSEFNDPILVPHDVPEPLGHKDTLVLDFPVPSSDYLSFSQRLDRNHVCLEQVELSRTALTGSVRVRNVWFEKRVTLRVTFDLWRSHRDVDCWYTQDSYLSSYSDSFCFLVSLPQELQPHQHVEFAVRYQAGDCEYWDSNHGDNYRVVWSWMKRTQHPVNSFDFGIHVDPYGSLTCSHGLLPDWSSYAGYENLGPYY